MKRNLFILCSCLLLFTCCEKEMIIDNVIEEEIEVVDLCDISLDFESPVAKCDETIPTAVLVSSEIVEIWGSDFDKGSNDNVTFYNELKFSFDESMYVPFVTITCEELENGYYSNNLKRFTYPLWIIDENDNKDSCTVHFDVQQLDESDCCLGCPPDVVPIEMRCIPELEVTLDSDKLAKVHISEVNDGSFISDPSITSELILSLGKLNGSHCGNNQQIPNDEIIFCQFDLYKTNLSLSLSGKVDSEHHAHCQTKIKIKGHDKIDTTAPSIQCTDEIQTFIFDETGRFELTNALSYVTQVEDNISNLECMNISFLRGNHGNNSRVFTCGNTDLDMMPIEVPIYAIDEVGNTSSCNINVDISDPHNTCYIEPGDCRHFAGVRIESRPHSYWAGVRVCIPIRTYNFNDISAMDLTVAWDPLVLDFIKVRNENVDDSEIENKPGSVKYSFEGKNVNLDPANRLLFEICFDVIGNAGDQTEIILFDEEVSNSLLDTELNTIEACYTNGLFYVR